ncbi:MAG TPA: hypothetical protein VI318_10970 [Baekduia sp.]
MSKLSRSLVTIAAVASFALAGLAPAAMARHGADDPAGHDAGDDHGGARVTVKARPARHGADDPAGHHHRRHHGRGHDDGPNHH